MNYFKTLFLNIKLGKKKKSALTEKSLMPKYQLLILMGLLLQNTYKIAQ